MRLDWPSREDREAWEIQRFIEHYRRLPEHRTFKIVDRQERPDWILQDIETGELVGVELTSTYLDDRSVPDLHQRSGQLPIPYHPEEIAGYGYRIAEAVQEKVRLARSGYEGKYPLLLSIYANEYVTLHMDAAAWESIMRGHESTFDNIAPFAEVVIWEGDPINGRVLRKRLGAPTNFVTGGGT